MTRPVTATDGRIALTLADHPELAAPNGAVSIQPAGMTDPLLVLRTGPAAYAVVSPICTHRGCTVEVAGDRLECPCHGSTYARDGTLLGGPAERSLTRLAATLQRGRLIIDLGRAP
jgi:Rieske Fe-S protein